MQHQQLREQQQQFKTRLHRMTLQRCSRPAGKKAANCTIKKLLRLHDLLLLRPSSATCGAPSNIAVAKARFYFVCHVEEL
mmetsp:Transcript_37905/g.75198  ORF Transcript_37905/g.75198 Transcript_37905/m.75198 type:complete len:80 (-) Transcript_37905:76-315(-)